MKAIREEIYTPGSDSIILSYYCPVSSLPTSTFQVCNVWSSSVSPVQLSLQADRFRLLMLAHLTSRFLFEITSKGSVVTDVMPVLSQMILDREADLRAALCLGVKMPCFSYHSLIVSDTKKAGDEFQNRDFRSVKWCWRCCCRVHKSAPALFTHTY